MSLIISCLVRFLINFPIFLSSYSQNIWKLLDVITVNQIENNSLDGRNSMKQSSSAVFSLSSAYTLSSVTFIQQHEVRIWAYSGTDNYWKGSWAIVEILLGWVTKNLGRLWLAYTELLGEFNMLQLISSDSRHFTEPEGPWNGSKQPISRFYRGPLAWVPLIGTHPSDIPDWNCWLKVPNIL